MAFGKEKKNQTEFDKGVGKANKILRGQGAGLMTQSMVDIMNRRKKMSEEGRSQEEVGAMKSKVASQMLAAEQKAARGLGATLGQQRGAGAAAQQRALSEAGMQARAGIERDLFLRQEEAKRSALDSYEDTARFDVQKRAQAKEFQASTGFQYEGLQMERDAIAAQQAAAAGQKEKAKVGSAVGTVAGGAIGASVGGPMGALVGASIGGAFGSLFD